MEIRRYQCVGGGSMYFADPPVPEGVTLFVLAADHDAEVARLSAKHNKIYTETVNGLSAEIERLRAELDSETKLHLENEAKYMALVIGLKDQK